MAYTRMTDALCQMSFCGKVARMDVFTDAGLLVGRYCDEDADRVAKAWERDAFTGHVLAELVAKARRALDLEEVLVAARNALGFVAMGQPEYEELRRALAKIPDPRLPAKPAEPAQHMTEGTGLP